jgi:hypothetical protein
MSNLKAAAQLRQLSTSDDTATLAAEHAGLQRYIEELRALLPALRAEVATLREEKTWQKRWINELREAIALRDQTMTAVFYETRINGWTNARFEKVDDALRFLAGLRGAPTDDRSIALRPALKNRLAARQPIKVSLTAGHEIVPVERARP